MKMICPKCGSNIEKTKKVKLTLSVDKDLVDFAKNKNINISRLLESHLAIIKSKS